MADEPIITKEDDFASLYANNVRYESSAWDLKLLFGELDQSKGPSHITIHTGITLPWPVVKVMTYFLLANCIIQQYNTAPIIVPTRVVPPRPDPKDEVWADSDPRMINYLCWVHDQLFGPNPYVPPGVAEATEEQKPITANPKP